jgi:hypothetical protein
MPHVLQEASTRCRPSQKAARCPCPNKLCTKSCSSHSTCRSMWRQVLTIRKFQSRSKRSGVTAAAGAAVLSPAQISIRERGRTAHKLRLHDNQHSSYKYTLSWLDSFLLLLQQILNDSHMVQGDSTQVCSTTAHTGEHRVAGTVPASTTVHTVQCTL